MAAPERLVETTPARAGWFWPLIYTFALHAILFALLFVSFAFVPEIPSAQPIIQATVYQLKAERPKSPPVPDKITAEAEKTKAAQREAERLEQQKRQREAQQQRQQAKEAAEAKRQTQIAEQAAALKQAEEKARQVAEQAKQQAAEAKRREAEQKQREAEAAKKRAAEQARQKAEAEAAKAVEAKRQAQIAAQQKREAEERRKREVEAQKRREAEEAKRRADEERKAKARADLIAAEVERRRAKGESERKQLIASLDELLIRLVSEQWIRPASTRDGISSEIQVSMLPDGTITQVVLVRSSGDTPFDNSTLAALRSIGRIPEMQQLDVASFDALYRKRNLIFKPEDLER